MNLYELTEYKESEKKIHISVSLKQSKFQATFSKVFQFFCDVNDRGGARRN